MTKELELVNKFAKEKNLDILYATKFGSQLYGTNTPASDTDIKGIFLPKLEELILGKAPDCFTFKTGTDFSKNTSDDVDMEFYSLHNFLKMVERGDTGALDLLFSFTNVNAIVYEDKRFDKVLQKLKFLFNPTNTRAFVGYAIGQAQKYSLKGASLKALENLIDFVKTLKFNEEDKLDLFLDEIVENCSRGTYVMEDFAEVKSGSVQRVRALRVLGSVHLKNITMKEFNERLQVAHKKYGVRSHSAKDAGGLDFKALSHAWRVSKQAEELLLTGEIKFPLEYADKVKFIKAGSMSKEDFESLLTSQIETVDNIISNGNHVENKFDKKVVEKLILSFYKNPDNNIYYGKF